MAKIGLAANFSSKIAVDFLNRTIKYLEERDISHCIGAEGDECKNYKGTECVKAFNPNEQDAYIVFGGDGTIIRVAREIKDSPILSIRVPKSRGFLAEVDARKGWSTVKERLDAYFAGKYYIVSAPRLKIFNNNQKIDIPSCLNEYLIASAETFKVIKTKIRMDSEETEIKCTSDGMIISTAAGSTGHALSSGGVIIHYGLPVMELCPINPLYYTSRPLILPDDETIDMIITKKGREEKEELKLIIDGQVVLKLKSPFKFSVSKDKMSTNFIRFHSFLSRISRNRMWR